MNDLLQNMRYLCDDTHMLTGITAAYGTPQMHETILYGRAQEMMLTTDGTFAPAVRPLDAQSIYDLASLTKLFTCILTMQLVELGRLSLDENIASIDSRFIHLHDVSVFDVLSFRVSLQTPGRIDRAPCREEALRRLFEVQPGPLPRIRLYSDINAMVMKYVIEQKTGMPFYDALQKHIFAPIGLEHTYSSVPEAQRMHCVCYNYEHRIFADAHILRTDTPPGTPHDPKAALLSMDGCDLCGHAGLFSTCADMIRFAQALLRGELLRPETLLEIGTNRTGLDYGDGTYRQYLGFLCFTKHPYQYLSEVPEWMSDRALGLSGFTGNHLSIDPVTKRFVLFLGNRCHGRVSNIQPAPGGSLSDYGVSDRGIGWVPWPDGRQVPSSARYVHFKDERLHAPIKQRMQALGWL